MTVEIINLDRKITYVKFSSKELSAICPIYVRPDFYNIEIEFAPDNHTLEVSTLRIYLLSFREEWIFAEDLAAKIADDLYEWLKPHNLSVKLVNQPENGIGIEIFQQLGWGEK